MHFPMIEGCVPTPLGVGQKESMLIEEDSSKLRLKAFAKLNFPNN